MDQLTLTVGWIMIVISMVLRVFKDLRLIADVPGRRYE